MARYLLQPARTGRLWWATVGVAVVALVLPAIVWLLLPASAAEPEREQVVLGAGDWEIETDLTCEANLLSSTGGGWDCQGVLLDTITQPATDDPDHNLRRMVRALAYTPLPQASVATVGRGRVLVDAPSGVIGMSVQGTGEHEGQQIFAVASGAGDVRGVSEQVFRAMIRQGPPGGMALPPSAVEELLEPFREAETL